MRNHNTNIGNQSPNVNAPSLTDAESRLVQTMRQLGAVAADSSKPSEKIERHAKLPHGPMMHALRELERKGLVSRIVARKDVNFFLNKGS